jgi:hypothetical protein
MASCWQVRKGGLILNRGLFRSKHTGRAKLISNRLSRRSIERRMGMSEASRTGLCNVIGLSGVDTFNRRYERRHHHNRQNGGKDRHSDMVASLVVVQNKPS